MTFTVRNQINLVTSCPFTVVDWDADPFHLRFPRCLRNSTSTGLILNAVSGQAHAFEIENKGTQQVNIKVELTPLNEPASAVENGTFSINGDSLWTFNLIPPVVSTRKNHLYSINVTARGEGHHQILLGVVVYSEGEKENAAP